jgi:hypothetical protein
MFLGSRARPVRRADNTHTSVWTCAHHAIRVTATDLLETGADDNGLVKKWRHRFIHQRMCLNEVKSKVWQRPRVIDTLSWPRIRNLRQKNRLKIWQNNESHIYGSFIQKDEHHHDHSTNVWLRKVWRIDKTEKGGKRLLSKKEFTWRM